MTKESSNETVDIVFNGAPGPDGPRFVEVERRGVSIKLGEWVSRPDGFWALRIPDPTATATPTKKGLRRARPSALQIAAQCPRAPYLSIHYPESMSETRFGTEVDEQVTVYISGDGLLPPGCELSIEAQNCLDWLSNAYPPDQWDWVAKRKVTLRDPTTGEEHTPGTPDLLCLHRTLPKMAVIDWKKKGQMFAGHLAAPRENKQQLYYLAAAWLEFSLCREIEEGEIVLVGWDERGVWPQSSGAITSGELIGIIDMIRAVPLVDPDGPMPEACVGDHCEDCYQRMHCDAHLLPATVALTAGVPAFSEGTPEITEGNIVQALSWLTKTGALLKAAAKMRELVKDNVDAYVKANGPVVVGNLAYQAIPTNGRRTGPKLDELEQLNLGHLIKPGKPGVKYDWKPLPKDR